MQPILLDHPLTWLLVPCVPLLLAGLLLVPRGKEIALQLLPLGALPAIVIALAAAQPASMDVPFLLLGAKLGLDGASRVFLFFAGLLWLAAGWFTLGYLRGDPRRVRFGVLMLVTMAGHLGLIVALDAATFYLCFAMMSFASYGLVIHQGDAEALRAGRVYIALVILGEVFLFSGLVMATRAAGSVLLDDWPAAISRSPARHAIVALIAVGFGIKAGALPLHVWLPLAHPAAPAPASAILSGALIKAGLLGWIRFLPLGTDALPDWGNLFIGLGLAAAFFGVLVGLVQRHPKVVLAYSSISQMGLMTIGIGAALVEPHAWPALLAAVALFALHHGLAKGALFLGVGVAQAAGSRGAKLLVALGLAAAGAALAGAPFFSGAAAKLSLKGALPAALWGGQLDLLLSLSSVGTSLLMARFLVVVWPDKDDAHRHTLTPGLWLPWALLLAASLALPWIAWIPEYRAMTLAALKPAYAWTLAWPVVLGAAIAVGVWLLSRRGWALPQVRIPPGDVLEVAVWLAMGVRTQGQRWIGAAAPQWPVFRLPAQRVWRRQHLRWLLRRSERRLTTWPLAGLAFLLVILLLLARLQLGG